MYIVFEGIDGSGKSTQCELLGHALDRRGITPIYLQEPSYGESGRHVREIIATNSDLDPAALHEMFTADRIAHVAEKIQPALQLIKQHDAFILLQSRGYLSAPAYQGHNSDDLVAMLRRQQDIAPKPDVFIYIDVDEQVAISRIEKRGDARVTFDETEKLRQIRKRYMELVDEPSERIVKFDGNQDKQTLHNAILDFVIVELDGVRN